MDYQQFIPETLSDTIECDELEFSLSNKGERNLKRKSRKRSNDFKRNENKDDVSTIQVVTAVERETGNKFFKAVESKRLTKEQVALALDGKIANGSTLITDKHSSYKSHAGEREDIKHRTTDFFFLDTNLSLHVPPARLFH